MKTPTIHPDSTVNEPRPQYAIIGRGLCAWHAECTGFSSSGGDLDSYVAEALEGALVYDALDADIGEFTHHVLNGPMVNPRLAPDAIAPLDSAARCAAARMLPGLEGSYRAYAAVAIADETFSGLDQVGVAVYERLLRKITGMRIGHVRNGQVDWEQER